MADSCSTCFYGRVTSGVRFCQVSPPNLYLYPEPSYAWPTVQDTDWCGQGADATTFRPFGVATSGAEMPVANLPASPPPGTRLLVSDSQNTNFGTAVSGGGSRVVPVYWDNIASNWKIG
jgi:hypothetical protein